MFSVYEANNTMCKKEELQDRLSARFCESCNESFYERYTGTKEYTNIQPWHTGLNQITQLLSDFLI